MLVRQIKVRERNQIERYAHTLEYLANENENPNIILLLDEIVLSNTTIPVILTDENENPGQYRNLPRADSETDVDKRQTYLRRVLEEMRGEHEPLEITLQVSDEVFGKKFIFYKNSILLSQLAYYPYVQLTIIAVFILVAFSLFNYSRTAEQNRLWVGLAKETAHQLGTPLSSLMAWSEFFKITYPDQIEVLKEFDKDVKSLEIIAERFSNIGSVPKLTKENVTRVVEENVSYLSTRLSTKIKLSVRAFPNNEITADLNKSLFAWVIENLSKNAADAMSGKGAIDIKIMKINDGVAIDISDTGKGMAKSKMHQIFKPGFTTKKRGWGLGLALTKRIIENYHQGKIFVKSS
ncbi:MAG: HAMP domain-containing histidine kinase, partial [Cytophagales bacterium]|nr:HAMP domain-containing histidine kinase [Cytophagales bacterium]